MYDGRETCEQFPGGGIGTGLGFGFGIPVFGTGGGFGIGGIRGGAIPGFVAGAGSGIGPVLDLESAFDVGFTSAEIAATIRREEEAIKAALSEGREAVVTISTGQQSGLTLVLNLAKGLFEIFDKDGRKLGGGVTPEAAIEAVNAGGLRPLPPAATFAEPSQPIPGPAEGGEFGELLRTILGALGQLRGGRGRPVGLEPVAIGGTVNVPVVAGSTSDPRGTLRPTAAAFVPKPPPPPPRSPERPTATQASANIVRVLLSLLLQRRRENFIRDAQRRQRELIAAAQAARRTTMPFGQSGFVGTTAVGPFLGGALGGLAGDAFEAILERLFRDRPDPIETQPFPRLPAFPPVDGGGGFPQLPPGIPGLTGGGGVCPPLFRDGGSVLRMSPVPWFPVQAPNGKWFFFGHLGKPTFSKLKSPRRHHHHPRKR